MNLLLVDQREDSYFVGPDDPRLAAILRLREERICLGMVDGPRGIGKWCGSAQEGVTVSEVRWEEVFPPSPPLHLVVGLPRPAEARRILVQSAAMGLRRLTFVELDRTPPGYVDSRSLAPAAIHRLLREGLEQGFHTALPRVDFVRGLNAVLGKITSRDTAIVLDPYLGENLLGDDTGQWNSPVTVILGSERGFSPGEQEAICATGMMCCHLGSTILRTETAVVAALTLAHRRLGVLASRQRTIIRPGEL